MFNFVNTGLDERILKSLDVEHPSEELVKAMNRSGLVQREVQVRGKHGAYIRKQWVRAGEVQSSGSSTGRKSGQSNSSSPKRGRQSLNSLQSMKGWEEDGLSTGTKDNDTFYAVDHDFDDVNGKIFRKTTYGAMVNGDSSGKPMTAQEVLAEVKGNSSPKKSM